MVSNASASRKTISGPIPARLLRTADRVYRLTPNAFAAPVTDTPSPEIDLCPIDPSERENLLSMVEQSLLPQIDKVLASNSFSDLHVLTEQCRTMLETFDVRFLEASAINLEEAVATFNIVQIQAEVKALQNGLLKLRELLQQPV